MKLTHRIYGTALTVASVLLSLSVSADSKHRTGTPPLSGTLETARDIASLQPLSTPTIEEIVVNGASAWQRGDNASPVLKPGDRVLLRGEGFGMGPDIEFSKVVIGNSRMIERDLPMFEGSVILLTRQFYETKKKFDEWPREILRWNAGEIEFIVPASAKSGALVVQVQKRSGRNLSLTEKNQYHSLWDPLTERITREAYDHASDSVSILGAAVASAPLKVEVQNPAYADMLRLGEAIYWAYDYNIGMTHHMSNLDWTKIMSGQAIDPVTGLPADPKTLFGAIPLGAGEMPEVASSQVAFDPYPITSPLKSVWKLRDPLKAGNTFPSNYVGYVYGEGINPVTEKRESHIGFSCASCHAQLVEYEEAPGKKVKKVIPGIPNPNWSMKWSVLDNMKGVKGKEKDAKGVERSIDKTLLLYNLPKGAGEHSLVRSSGETHSPYRNDNLFSPIAIPVITRHNPLRRALSRTEMVVGFEGSYVHSEEPDGAIGAMKSKELKALSTYMTSLDGNDQVLERVGLYRTLASKGRLALIDGVGEGEFVQNGKEKYPLLMSRVMNGEKSFAKSCVSCHANNFGTYTDENMMPLNAVGTYFSPTIYNKETQAIRTSPIRNLYWVAQRGLLHDGHVKTVEDLLAPERLDKGSDLYRRLYTLGADTFCIPKGNKEQEQALRNQAYFVDVSWRKDALCWDYQKMRREFGPRELGSKDHIELPEVPHPWPAAQASEVEDLTLYLLTL